MRLPIPTARLPRLVAGALLPAVLALAPGAARAAEPAQQTLLADGCKTLAERVSRESGNGPLFLASYEPAPGGGPLAPALRNAAFVYDNALAGIALVACKRPAEARRIADAVLQATRQDRHFRDARLRNAYRAGPLPAGAVPLPGWWDEPSKRWFEDAYQAGTATGNVAWAALLLLAVHEATRDARYLDGAAALMGWVHATVPDTGAPAGYIGGFFGHEPKQTRQGWKSTEHNVDTYAAFSWLASQRNDPRWRDGAARSRGFVGAMWQAREGRFIIGTRDDGRAPNAGPSALDAVLWPLIAIPDPPQDWRRNLAWVEAKHRAGAGYGFKGGPDGIWTEGTGQAALVLQAAGQAQQAQPLWQLLLSQRAPSGMLYATPEARISTGLSIGPTSTTEDFHYFHLPHLGATAWAVLAAARWNPFRPGGCLEPSCPPPAIAAAAPATAPINTAAKE
ncbi:hypothetical protein C265_27015 [Cupriavidus sp. GA3-3]|uniref:hypothetical protein n=1 Tax=Cupriavidus sp. GA3-3 TaxID=1229514 RepID=UPI00033036EE|nr:hypothetical protein [Cupriavidus sp. GA3-3]EON16587.1 hypothetical protein C265_27015 [Cupriavidus sp. GA3-3]